MCPFSPKQTQCPSPNPCKSIKKKKATLEHDKRFTFAKNHEHNMVTVTFPIHDFKTLGFNHRPHTIFGRDTDLYGTSS